MKSPVIRIHGILPQAEVGRRNTDIMFKEQQKNLIQQTGGVVAICTCVRVCVENLFNSLVLLAPDLLILLDFIY